MTGLFIAIEKVKSHDYVTWNPGSVCSPAGEPDGAECETEQMVGPVGDGEINDVFLSPNPAFSDVDLQFRSYKNADLTIEVTNVLGAIQMTSQQNAFKGNNKINLELDDLAKGVYMVKIQSGNWVKTLPLVINN